MEESLVLFKNKYINAFYKFFVYFLLYSIIGFFFETVFAIFTKGVIESRQSFIFGPFCAIYGIGALLMILFLSKYKERKIRVFLLGASIGTISEYLMSYFCEVFFHFKWWDYTEYLLNINGRVCLLFFIIWGFLAIALIEYVNPIFNAFLKKTNNVKIFKNIINFLVVFIIFDIIATIFALKEFYYKIDNKFNISKKENYNVARLNLQDDYQNYYEEKMLKLYPNIIVTNEQNEDIYVDSLYKNVKTYYIKLFNKK